MFLIQTFIFSSINSLFSGGLFIHTVYFIFCLSSCQNHCLQFLPEPLPSVPARTIVFSSCQSHCLQFLPEPLSSVPARTTVFTSCQSHCLQFLPEPLSSVPTEPDLWPAAYSQSVDLQHSHVPVIAFIIDCAIQICC